MIGSMPEMEKVFTNIGNQCSQDRELSDFRAFIWTYFQLISQLCTKPKRTYQDC